MIGLRGGGPPSRNHGGSYPPFPHPFGQQRIGRDRTAPTCGGPISATTRSRSVTNAISPPRGDTNVFAEPVLEYLEADRAHSPS